MSATTLDLHEKIDAVNERLLAGEPENISYDDFAGYTGYKPQAIVDAMNAELLGIWGFEELSSEIVGADKGQLALSNCRVWLAGIDFRPTSWGQSNVTRGAYGDARKGAQTDSIKKALSYFSIGNRAYHGLLEAPQKENQRNQQAPQKRQQSAKVEPMITAEQLSAIEKGCKMLNRAVPADIKQFSLQKAKDYLITLRQDYDAQQAQQPVSSGQPEVQSSAKAETVSQPSQPQSAPSEVDKVRSKFADLYHLKDDTIEERWTAYKVKVFGVAINDVRLTPSHLQRLTNALLADAKSMLQNQTPPTIARKF